jgi:8-oxo-dGTP pyrophosphatase MutT (NUDIX family)
VKTLFKSSLAIIRNNKLLLLREFEQDKLITPGGQIEDNESAIESLKREMMEELGTEIDTNSLKYIGKFEDIAAGKKDTKINIQLFLGEVVGEMKPANEIKELIWFGKNDDWNTLSPMLKNKILPTLIEKGYIK